MLAKSKIISIVLAIIFCVSAVTCGIVFGVVKSKPQSGAITGTETSLTGYIGNLLTSDGKVNETTYNSLISKVGAIGSVSGQVKSSAINSGTPVIFQMGTAGGNPVYWQVTYRTKDYITIMMTRPYTVEYFNSSGKTYANGVFSGTSQTSYSTYGNYSQSTLRDATKKIYIDMNSTNSVLSQIVVSPSAMASATGANWQYSSTRQPDAQYDSTPRYSHHNALYSYSGSYNNTWTWDNTVYSDMFWIPSFYELYNTSTSSYSFNGGLWGLSSQSYVGFSTASFLSSSVTTSYCWLRSGLSNRSGYALRVDSSGESYSNSVSNAHGVRPSAHISLKELNKQANMFTYTGSNYTLTLIDNGDGTATIDKCTLNSAGEIVIPGVVNGLTITSTSDGESNMDGTYTSVFSSNVTSVTLPDTMTSIGVGCFYGCANLTSIKLSQNLQTISEAAFRDCSALQNITIPASVVNIDSVAFTRCTNLTKMKIERDIVNNDINYSVIHGSYTVNYVFTSKECMEKGLTMTNVFSDAVSFSYESTITLNYNGATGGNTTTELLCAGDSTTTATYGTLPTPTKTNYVFMGWYKSSDFSGSAVTASDEVVENHTLYAKFVIPEITITFDFQGGSGGTSSVVASFEKAMPTATAPTRIGYTFGGYYTGTNGSGTQYYTASMASAKNSDLVVNTTLYAKWTINTYTITIQTIEGGVVSNTGGTYNYGSTITSFAAPNVGKAFLYWVRASDNAQILENPINQAVTKNETYTAIFGASVEGVAVASTIGGLAYILGDNYDNLSDTDTITFSTKQALAGYTFSHWEDMNGNNLGTEMSIRLQKSLVMDNIITAVYVQSANTNTNYDVNNI